MCKLHDYSAFPQFKDDLLDEVFMDLCKSLNELFITDVMLSLVEQKTVGEFCSQRNKILSYMDLKDSLHYFLKYRHYTAQELELFLKGLDTCPFIA